MQGAPAARGKGRGGSRGVDEPLIDDGVVLARVVEVVIRKLPRISTEHHQSTLKYDRRMATGQPRLLRRPG